MRIEFNRNTRFILYHVHNRQHDGQVVLVWQSGLDYAFTFHDEPVRQRAGRDWACIGELVWCVEGHYFVYELHPFRQRSERELQERAERTKRHREYRQRLWERYELEERLERPQLRKRKHDRARRKNASVPVVPLPRLI